MQGRVEREEERKRVVIELDDSGGKGDGETCSSMCITECMYHLFLLLRSMMGCSCTHYKSSMRSCLKENIYIRNGCAASNATIRALYAIL